MGEPNHKSLSEPSSSLGDAQQIVLQRLFFQQKKAFRRNRYLSYAARQQKLLALYHAIKLKKDAIAEAIRLDFGYRAESESQLLEIIPSLHVLQYHRRHLRQWMRPESRPVSAWFQPGRARLMPQPLGVVGIVVPWNYPFYLAIAPLVSAIAAGNRVMLKLSELTPSVNTVIKHLFQDIFNSEEVAVITGDADVAKSFVRLAFDHLIFTGSTAVGRQVLQAASENLTPTTLELGGKSPAIISPDYPLEKAVESILMGKLLNAGQTCVAPDYVMLPEDRVAEFVKLAQKAVQKFYPDLPDNKDYTAIINQPHFQRLSNLLDDARDKGGEVIALAKHDKTKLLMAPTLIQNTHNCMRVLQEEIFGPILPIVTYKNLDEVINYIGDRPHPLALYYFDYSKINIRRMMRNTISGGVTINDTLLHVAQNSLPFGGVGASGMGHYHGREGFNGLSKLKPIFYQRSLRFTPFLYPPYTSLSKWLMKLIGR